MASATISPSMQNEVRTHGANVERMSLRIIRDHGTAADAMQRAEEMYDNAVQKAEARYRPSYACKPGCTHCCSAPIRVAKPEAELLARHLKAMMPAEEIERWKSRARAILAARAAGGRPRCVFLGDDNLCTVYSLRPLMCRACNSDDVEPCAKWAEEGDDTSVRVFMLPRLYAMVTVLGVWKAVASRDRTESAPQAELLETLLTLL
jgi:Fe-S-cluster containining protein